MSRLLEQYQKSRTELKDSLKLSSVEQVPKLEKIVLNVGLGSKADKKFVEAANNTLRKITGQQPIKTIARKSIASFKLREGSVNGIMVTLRGKRMYEFLDRLINIVLPRLRDFHGVPIKSFDPQGNYSLGLKEQSVFPELSYEDTVVPHGIQITLVTSKQDKQSSIELLKALGMPFEKEK